MATTKQRCTARRHGTKGAYMWWKCRCPAALIAYSRYQHALRTRTNAGAYTDATGTARRLRGLAALGWSWQALGTKLGWHRTTVKDLAHMSRPTVTHATAETIRQLAHELVDQPAPAGYGASRARTNFAEHGWLPLVAWADIDDPACIPDAEDGTVDDEPDVQVIAEALAGRTRWSWIQNEADRQAVLREMADRGISATTVRRLLKMSTETYRNMVEKYVTAERVAA